MSSPKDKLCHCGLLLEYLSKAQMYSCNQNTRDTEEGRRVQEKAINTSLTAVVLVGVIIPALRGVDLVQNLQALLSCGVVVVQPRLMGSWVGSGGAGVGCW